MMFTSAKCLFLEGFEKYGMDLFFLVYIFWHLRSGELLEKGHTAHFQGSYGSFHRLLWTSFGLMDMCILFFQRWREKSEEEKSEGELGDPSPGWRAVREQT